MTQEEALALHDPFIVNGIYQPSFKIDCRKVKLSTLSLSRQNMVYLDRANQAWLDVLSGCKGLKALALKYPSAANLSALSKLKLRYLRIDGGNRIKDWSGISELNGLKGLSINNTTTIRDIGFLEPLTSLEKLYLSGGLYRDLRLNSLAPIEKLRRLRALSISFLAKKGLDLSPVATLPRLECFYFCGKEHKLT